MENKLTDTVVRASNETIVQNARGDEKCSGLERRASTKCCPYCGEHEGQYSFHEVDAGKLGGRHEACKCSICPLFDNVSLEVRAKMDEAKMREDGLVIYETDKAFKFAVDMAKANNKHGGYVDTHSVEELKTFRKFLSTDGMCGVAIKPDGDITCVFKNEQAEYRGAIYDLILTARENGGKKMDCYGVDLVNMYEKCGFKPVFRVKFDPVYVDDEFLLKQRDDIYFMMITEKSTLDVIEDYATKKYKRSSLKELEKLPVFDYDTAGKKRDDMLKLLYGEND